jgi:hypothetical protein
MKYQDHTKIKFQDMMSEIGVQIELCVTLIPCEEFVAKTYAHEIYLL